MRSLWTTILCLTPVYALKMLPGGLADVNVLEYDIEHAYTKFEVAPGIQDSLTSPLVLQLQVNPTHDLLTSSISLNDQPLDITWIRSPSQSIQPTTQNLTVPDRLGFSHSLQVSLDGEATFADSVSDHATQSINLRIDSVDGFHSGWSLTVVADPTATRRLLRLVPTVSFDTVHFDQFEKSFMVDQPTHDVTANEPVGYDQDAYDIESEIESLLLLEAEAGKLNSAIEAKKIALAKCLKDHRDGVTLKHLLQQCDGLLCAAKVITQRICDKVGILTVPQVGYALVQDPHAQTLIDLGDEKKGNSTPKSYSTTEKHANATHTSSIHIAAAIQPIQIVHPQNVLIKVLGAIAACLGLTALFQFIHRKCMSARRRVDRAADAEERRNARAYRRAARRARMRRNWDAFTAAISCFRAEPETRIEDYEEKRALILQEAFLEQDLDAAEKGEIMEAEIRELRHAREIVATLVRVDENRYDLMTPISDPPPPLVPLPYTPATRSRESSITLPSYCSDILPDYTSRYARTETASSSSSLRSNSAIITSASSETDAHTDSTPRSESPHSSRGSRTSRYTPTSSVIETSPRQSQETLRTNCRYSRDTMRTS